LSAEVNVVGRALGGGWLPFEFVARDVITTSGSATRALLASVVVCVVSYEYNFGQRPESKKCDKYCTH
jgi:hypothetical protein